MFWVKRGLVALVTLVVAWAVLCTVLVAHPHVDAPARVDAVLVLGPPDEDGRLQVAEQMAARGLTSTVVVSVNNRYQKTAVNFCRQPPHGIAVYCFTPDPGTTRGEAEHLRQLVRQHGWTRVAVVTSTYHVSRARMIVQRCFGGTLLMVPARASHSVADWAFQYVYQSAGWIKAQFLRSC